MMIHQGTNGISWIGETPCLGNAHIFFAGMNGVKLFVGNLPYDS